MLALVFALIAVACGDDAAAEPELEGLWFLESDSQACGLALYLEDGEYEFATVCELTSGEIVSEVEAGTFSEDGRRITLQPVRSSCADDRAYPETVEYEFIDGGLLRISAPQGVLVFERLKAEASNGRVTYGCFGEDGNFAPMPVAIIAR
jgi:hypothetical protein